MELTLEAIQNLVDLATEKHLSELTLEEKDQKITIKTASGVAMPTYQAPPMAIPASVPVSPEKASHSAATVSSEPPATNLYKVTSPMVGTFYRSPSPDSPAFVEVGTQVGQGQTLCIIEAMKLMNELESEVSGIVRKISVENGSPVEFGQALIEIEVQ
jgi:acetyl-CoA carboxylase biotin carboxyl carrier protein